MMTRASVLFSLVASCGGETVFQRPPGAGNPVRNCTEPIAPLNSALDVHATWSTAIMDERSDVQVALLRVEIVYRAEDSDLRELWFCVDVSAVNEELALVPVAGPLLTMDSQKNIRNVALEARAPAPIVRGILTNYPEARLDWTVTVTRYGVQISKNSMPDHSTFLPSWNSTRLTARDSMLEVEVPAPRP